MKLEVVAPPPVGRHRRLANGSSSAGIAPVALTQPTPNSEEPIFVFRDVVASRHPQFLDVTANLKAGNPYRPIVERMPEDAEGRAASGRPPCAIWWMAD